METRKERYAKYREQIATMPDEQFRQSPSPLSSGDEFFSDEGGLPSSNGPRGPYSAYLRHRRISLWIKLGLFGLAIIGFVLWYFLLIARS